jgi:WD40-like Beta Propeller Repeat
VVALAVAAVFALAGCPKDHSLGSVGFVRAGSLHSVSLANCVDRVIGHAPRPASSPSVLRSPQGHVATIRETKPKGKIGAQSILVDGQPVYTVREDYRRAPAGEPGPLGLVTWSPDGRWLFFYVDPMGSASIAADGLELRALRVADGHVATVATMLMYPDYLTWCGASLVLTGGGDRIATHHKRLLVARAPDWRPKLLWAAPKRAFGSLACAPDGRSVAVLSQADSDNGYFFATRWELWRVGLDGSHALLDQPPAGFADESPRFAPDGRSLLFVRERHGVGSLMLWRAGRLFGPIASLGYSLGYYGHHDWELSWRR